MHPSSRCSQLYANDMVHAPGGGCGPATTFTSPIFPDLAAACGMPNPFPACGGQNVVVLHGQVRELGPGTYGDVIVMGGGGSPGSLILTGGDYRFCNLRTSRRAVLQAKTATTIHVRGLMSLSNGTVTGPAGSVSPCNLQILVAGPRVHISRHAVVKARLCAPNAALYVTNGANLSGGFAAGRIRLGRGSVAGAGCRAGGGTTTTISATTTTTRPSSTTTTLPAVCGNGVREGREQCDGADLGGETCPSLGLGPGTLTCLADCTFDRLGCTCGNGTVDASTGEQCDPAAATSTCAANEDCGVATGPDRCTCIPSSPTLLEVCGNCLDDDLNGLTDFEDPACCPSGRSFPLTLRRGRIKPQGGTQSRLRLRAVLASAGLEGVNPQKEDVFLQLRPERGTDIFCARIPAAKWKTKNRRAFRFKDRKHTVASALGVDVAKIKVKKSKQVRLRTRARKALLKAPSQGRLQVTVGFRDAAAGDAQNRCSSAVAQFRAGRKGRLIAP
jgi:hypothetical protein